MNPTRRTVFNLAAAAFCVPVINAWAFAKSDFWNQKDPSQWSDAERDRILTNSPWARKATITFERGKGDGLSEGGGGPMGGMGGGGSMGGMGGGGRGGPPMGGGDMGGGGRGGPPMGGEGGTPGEGGAPKLDVTVRWESAAPVRAALHGAPAETGDYVVSVIGIPAMGMSGRGGMPPGRGAPPDDAQSNVSRQPPNGEDMLTRYQQTSQIEVKGQPVLHPRIVERQDSPGGQRILFHFDRSELPISAASKEVTFTMHMGPMVLKAKFTVKDMSYKEQLAL